MMALAVALIALLPVPPVAATGPVPAEPPRHAEAWRFFAPVLVHRVEPKYPRRARRQGVEGQVVIQALIHRNGTVSDLEVLRSSAPGHGFEEAAMLAVRRWRYAAAVMNRQPVDVYSMIIINFTLDD